MEPVQQPTVVPAPIIADAAPQGSLHGNNKKRIVLIAVLVLVVLLVIVFILVQTNRSVSPLPPQKNDSSIRTETLSPTPEILSPNSVYTYSDEQYQITFPKTWTVTRFTQVDGGKTIQLKPQGQTDVYPSLQIFPLSASSSASTSDFLIKVYKFPQKNVMINKTTALLYAGVEPQKYKEKSVYDHVLLFSNVSHPYELKYSYYGDTLDPRWDSLFEKITATFTLLEQ